MNGFPLYPVGFVRSPFKRPMPPEEFRGTLSRIELKPEFEEALEGLQEGELLLILYRFHLCRSLSMKVHPRGDPANPLRGVFSTCSPNRPNHIGASIVRLKEVTGPALTVESLDAVDGTPVMDIKPFRGINWEGIGQAALPGRPYL
ncbi:MAG: tRNA (N6-threonylcarbamoyladenosine(37)-N6)-methyltransferase TrmO [Thermovirgaceae bacterium]|nr:tRNA (N6-threonylcarbamoyladenosine(37)-N6)-methyltransferase TrmO [Synergistales bacterium]HPC76094.1 tRNA (N6-threonylcarbamoyladenosine(37)-N6)-methyltransferase TrmO [Synergistales bacterium]HRS48770.1 tRNA (N6-threonylcarbamoyladenosine(37)-N6)-methyltransferase TrmO [Thermovirgaceae bacterium]HRU90975.1 tRNA (N6-threonylcarbamoyladenosine(37)-N6)-methyltransferase TrmO [Thermovirgaceae bacterium]